jgi:hypothetical protein
VKRRWLWIGSLATVILLGGAAVKWHSLAGKLYRKLFPKPLVGETQVHNVQGINGAGFSDLKPEDFSFIVVGHLYGTIEGDDRLPDQALLSAIPFINRLQPAFMVSLGDMVMHQDPQDFTLLKQTLLTNFKFPFFNTVGNHDVLDRNYYEASFGTTFFTFDYGPARLVFLDTEKKDCDLSSQQVDMVKGAVQKALRSRTTHYIFLFMHKTLFFMDDVLSDLRARQASPNGWRCYQTGYFNNLLDDVLLPAAQTKPVYLFAGDVGAWGNLTPYYEHDPETNLTMIMTGLGDTSQDNMIQVHVEEEKVDLQAIFLDDFSSHLLTEFSPAYWERVAKGDIELNP